MIAIRILVDPARDGDMNSVNELQNDIVLTGPPAPPAASADLALCAVDRSDELQQPAEFLLALDHAIGNLADSDVPQWVEQAYRRLADARDHTIDRDITGRAIADGLSAGLEDIAAQVKSMGRVVNGWAINDAGADFDMNYLLRAAVAYSQIYINPAAEASYPVCEQDDEGHQLNGSNNYAITFRVGQFPPADYFWSMTVYHAQGLLYANELDRYAITDRTPDLEYNGDGSLTVTIRTGRPVDGKTANWLPCPPGDFRLMLRLYGPRLGSWAPPPVMRER